MKITLLCALVYAATAVPTSGTKFYPRYIQFPGGDGEMHRVDLEAEPDVEFLNEMQRNPANNQYLLFTRRNRRNSQTLRINDANSIRNSNFNAQHPTVVSVHGWLSNENTRNNPTIRDAFLNQGEYNVIIMDWRRLAMRDYVTAANGVPAIGRALGQFLNFLHQTTGAPFNTMHLVGFSLGAHVVGNAGRELRGQVARITGLDPAGPLWNVNRNRLSSSDGIYVEAIHTDGGYTIDGLGIGSPIADVDFFPNGGRSQPGCLTNLCNHNRAWELFAATVARNHLEGRQCSSMSQVNLNTCRGGRLNMGNAILNKRGSGIYRLTTGSRHPF
ncbi:unnamed protein product [Leptosia nina]|uniref:Lipase domain-containing protein n=1 Tax=Leptosia nina TaxID=320188 RepID=A0AAV1J1D9_9NEOP